MSGDENQNDVFDFQWEIHDSGYDWIKAPLLTDKEGRPEPARPSFQHWPPDDRAGFLWLDQILSEETPSRGSQWVLHAKPLKEFYPKTRSYRPFKAPDLFIEFAQSEPSLKSVREFANKHGFLGVGAAFQPDGHGGARYGEPFELWKREIESMRMALHFWRLAKAGREDELLSHIVWPGDFVGIRWQGKVIHLHWDHDQEPGVLESMETEASKNKEDYMEGVPLILPAYRLIHEQVHKALKRFSVTPITVWTPSLNRQMPQLTLKFRPRNLISALWLQFAQAVTEINKFRP
ncbi:hypothetical protein MYX78_09600, partial [Acidobacteria bacterium AH-259-G07]|nr:hypothetical protein [Acidobacteria bacterium AH-259-G07]